MNPMQRGMGERKLFRAVACAAAALFCLTETACRKESPLEWARLPVELKVEVARTPEERERGLKFRPNLPRDEGMYFVFEKEQQLSFYMRDTRIPLSIAFVSGDGIIESIADMLPLDERSVSSADPAQFALEVNKRWFEDNDVQPGDKVVLEGNRIVFFRRIGLPVMAD